MFSCQPKMSNINVSNLQADEKNSHSEFKLNTSNQHQVLNSLFIVLYSVCTRLIKILLCGALGLFEN